MNSYPLPLLIKSRKINPALIGEERAN